MPKKTQLPSDWRPNAKHSEIEPNEEVLLSEADRFRDSALAHGRTYINWDAAFNNWLRSPYRQPNPNTHTTATLSRSAQRNIHNADTIRAALSGTRSALPPDE